MDIPDDISHQSDAGVSLAGWLVVIISALLCLGALMVFSAGASLDQNITPSRFWTYTSVKRILFVPVVWLLLAIVGRLDYRRWVFNCDHWLRSPIIWLQLISIITLVLVLIPCIGTEVNYSRRWLRFGSETAGLQFQPSELAKWVTVMFIGCYASWRRDEIRTLTRGFLPPVLVLGVVVALIGIEDFGTAALVAAAGIAILLIAGARWWHMLILIPVAAVAFYVMVYQVDYRWDRVLAYWHGSAETADTAYQAKQSVMAIASGGVWGVGLGNGTVKLGWLPEDTSDFIFAVIGEELGLAGCAMVIGLFVALMVCSMVVVHRARDGLGMLLAVAVAATIGAQAAMNLLVVTHMAPTKGIALPFVSAGGSGLVLTAIAAGVLVNVARQGTKGS
jgi:cell division protein FtsW